MWANVCMPGSPVQPAQGDTGLYRPSVQGSSPGKVQVSLRPQGIQDTVEPCRSQQVGCEVSSHIRGIVHRRTWPHSCLPSLPAQLLPNPSVPTIQNSAAPGRTGAQVEQLHLTSQLRQAPSYAPTWSNRYTGSNSFLPSFMIRRTRRILPSFSSGTS